MTGRKKPNQNRTKGEPLGGVLWEGCLNSSDSSLKMWLGHHFGFLSTSVQPTFHRLPLSEVFPPFPRTLSFTQSTEVQLQPGNNPPSPKEIVLMGMVPTASPQHCLLCTRAGVDTCPQRGLGAGNVNWRWIPAYYREQATFLLMSEHTDISHGATFLNFPGSSFCSSWLRMRLLLNITAGDPCMLYIGSPGA